MLEKNNRMLVFGIVAFVFLFALVYEGFEDTTGAFERNAWSSIETNKYELKVGDVVLSGTGISGNIYNDGIRDIDEDEPSIKVGFFEWDGFEYQTIGGVVIERVKSKGSRPFEYTWDQVLAEGQKIKIFVDNGNRIDETNEDDNTECYIVGTAAAVDC